MQTGTVSRLQFCGRSWGLKVYFGRSIVLFWKSYICSNKLDVQEVSHSSTGSEIISLDTGLRMDGLPALDLWHVTIKVLRSSKSTESQTHPAAGHCSRNPKFKPKQNWNRDVDQLSHVDHVTTNANSCQDASRTMVKWITYPIAHVLLKRNLSCTYLKTTKPW